MISQLDIILTPSCYRVAFQYHPLLVKCIKRIPSARYMSDGKCWEVATRDAHYLRLMGQWTQDKRLVAQVRWLRDDEPVISYEPLPMPTLSVPHNW